MSLMVFSLHCTLYISWWEINVNEKNKTAGEVFASMLSGSSHIELELSREIGLDWKWRVTLMMMVLTGGGWRDNGERRCSRCIS